MLGITRKSLWEKRKKEETLRESIKRIFVKEGYTVDGAESAEKGLALLETGMYDLILTDIILPASTGSRSWETSANISPEQTFIV